MVLGVSYDKKSSNNYSMKEVRTYCKGLEIKEKLDVDPRRDYDASPMSSYRCMLRPTWMFLDRMIAPINVHSIS